MDSDAVFSKTEICDLRGAGAKVRGLSQTRAQLMRPRVITSNIALGGYTRGRAPVHFFYLDVGLPAKVRGLSQTRAQLMRRRVITSNIALGGFMRGRAPVRLLVEVRGLHRIQSGSGCVGCGESERRTDVTDASVEYTCLVGTYERKHADDGEDSDARLNFVTSGGPVLKP